MAIVAAGLTGRGAGSRASVLPPEDRGTGTLIRITSTGRDGTGPGSGVPYAPVAADRCAALTGRGTCPGEPPTVTARPCRGMARTPVIEGQNQSVSETGPASA